MSMQNVEPNISAESISKLTELYISYSKNVARAHKCREIHHFYIIFACVSAGRGVNFIDNLTYPRLFIRMTKRKLCNSYK